MKKLAFILSLTSMCAFATAPKTVATLKEGSQDAPVPSITINKNTITPNLLVVLKNV